MAQTHLALNVFTLQLLIKVFDANKLYDMLDELLSQQFSSEQMKLFWWRGIVACVNSSALFL